VTAVRVYERGDPAALAALLTPDDAVRTYLDALRWSTEVLRSVSPAQPAGR
jgi:hypothetical protein